MGVSRSPRERDGSATGLPLLVVVAGPPGAGKTTIANAVARRLGAPLVAKDAIKEVLHDALGGEGREWSRQLGVATFDIVFHVARELLRNGCSLVAEGNFGRAEPFLALPPARVLQLHVTASPETLRERFATRERRHPVHYDAEVVDEIPPRVAAGEWDSLTIGDALLQVDTTSFPDVHEVADAVATMVAQWPTSRSSSS